MQQGFSLLVYPVTDLARAKSLYTTLLGVEPYADAAYYVGFRIGEQEIGLDPRGHASGLNGPLGYLSVADIHESLRTLVEGGATIQQDVKDVGRGKLVASVRDADGNLIGLMQTP